MDLWEIQEKSYSWKMKRKQLRWLTLLISIFPSWMMKVAISQIRRMKKILQIYSPSFRQWVLNILGKLTERKLITIHMARTT